MKHRYPLILFIFSLFLLSCSTKSDQQNAIDYSEIPISEIQKEFSITESENYIPAQITRVMVSDDGQILVSQRPEKSIHQFDSLGNYITQVAGPGRGPGELSQYANAHFNGKILVMSNNNNMLTEFRPNEENIFEYRTDHRFRLPGPMRGIRSLNNFSAFYVKVDSARTPFGRIPPEFTTDFIHLVQITGDSLQIEEKILSLEKHSHYVELTDGGNSMTYSFLPYRYSDKFSPLPDKQVLVQRPRNSLIQVYDGNMTLDHELNLNVKDRLVTEKDMEYHFPEIRQSERRKRRTLIKDVKPPFTQVLMDSQEQFWLLTDETENGKEYVIMSYEGEPVGRIQLPKNSTMHTIKDEKLYLTNDAGEPTIDVYSFNL